jgi:L-threonylcarbamoyladenylate synthase
MTVARILDGSQAAAVIEAAGIIRAGGLVVVPTDTLYGLAVSVFQVEAVQRMFAVKQRATQAPPPILLGTAADLPILVDHVSRAAWRLIDAFWPGPLTLVLPAKTSVPKILTSHPGMVGVRVPGARTCLEMLQVLGEPVTGTSANISGQPPASRAEEALRQFGDRVDAILTRDNEVREKGPSTVIEIGAEGVVLRRTGVISTDTIRQATGLAVTGPVDRSPSPHYNKSRARTENGGSAPDSGKGDPEQ